MEILVEELKPMEGIKPEILQCESHVVRESVNSKPDTRIQSCGFREG